MDVLISQVYDEWTKGKNPRAARINIFERIRDIPYAVTPQILDSDKGPRQMLIANRGSCQPKHYLLGEMFERLGISTFYVVYQFKWDELEIDYPRSIKRLAKRMPVSRHLACREMIGDDLVLIDVTCDIPLEKIGIPVNKNWDGFTNLALPIVPLGEEQIYHSSEKGYFGPPLFSEIETEFYRELNKWLDKVRVED